MTVNGALTPVSRSAETEADRYGRFVRRVVSAYARRVADADIEGLHGLAALQADVDTATLLAVANLHGTYSWTEIGRALGISRQAAQQRFGKRIGEAGR